MAAKLQSLQKKLAIINLAEKIAIMIQTRETFERLDDHSILCRRKELVKAALLTEINYRIKQLDELCDEYSA